MLVSPAEPEKLRLVGTVSAVPERYGADFLFMSPDGWVGIQRKEIKDFIASLVDGRLSKEIAQLQSIPHRILILEGDVRFTNAGELVTSGFSGQSMTLKQWRGILWSVRYKGIWVETTEDIPDTIQTLSWIESWFKRDSHVSLERRPGPSGMWGSPTNEDYQRHLVMGLPGVGIELAKRIVDMFGVPWKWEVSREDLMKVEGIGKKKAETIYACLEKED